MKALIKQFLPPILLSLVRHLIPRQKLLGLYEGRFDLAPNLGALDVFASESWMKHVSNNLRGMPKLNYQHTFYNNHDLLLSLLVAMKESTIVMDFGGGVGLGSFWARSQSDNCESYIVVDNAENVKIGRNFFSTDKRIQFFETIPEKKVDVLNINGTLHYIVDWENVLLKLLDLKPEYVLMSRHISVEGLRSQQYTVQDLDPHGKQLVTLVPEDELLKVFQRNRYSILGNWVGQNLNYRFLKQEFPENVFEKTLLFRRDGAQV